MSIAGMNRLNDRLVEMARSSFFAGEVTAQEVADVFATHSGVEEWQAYIADRKMDYLEFKEALEKLVRIADV